MSRRILQNGFPAAAMIALLFAVLSTFLPIPASRLAFHDMQSVRIVDRRGRLLRELISPRQGYGRWTPLGQISPDFLQAVLATEDRHFFRHRGVHLPSIARAAWQNLRAGRIVSGGSTLSQQLVRQLYHIPSTVPGKLLEAWLALRLEHTLRKEAILAQYVNRVPFGNLNYGISAASWFYFQRPPQHLSLAQAAFLAGLPQAPGRLNPIRNPDAARKRQQRVLQAMLQIGMIDSARYQEALQTPIEISASRQPFFAPHVVTRIARQLTEAQIEAAELRLTLDLDLQQAVERAIRQELRLLKRHNAGNAAAVVLENATGDILAWCGSADFFDSERQGQIDGVLMRRQPGSTLKPFVYLSALQAGYTAASLLPDVPLDARTGGGDYTPRNYDGRYHGPVRLRTALACSYNIPAVYLTQLLGVDRILQMLHAAGFATLDRPADFYGPGLALGNGEVRLLELARAYAGLARAGRLPAVRLARGNRRWLPAEFASAHRFASAAAAEIIADILADAAARAPAFGEESPLNLPFPAAAKTGTTKNYRDNWTVGLPRDYTAAVWVGNFDGSDMHHLSGVAGAAPIFRDILLLLHRNHLARSLPRPAPLAELEICPLSGARAAPWCPSRKTELFLPNSAPTGTCRFHRLLRHPENGKLYVALVFPERYRDWAAAQGIPQPQFLFAWNRPPEARKTVRQILPPQILFPDDGDIFKIDPDLPLQFQKIRFRARVQNATAITWILDGRPLATVSSPFSLLWQLEPGEHTLALRPVQGSTLRPRPIRFRVLR